MKHYRLNPDFVVRKYGSMLLGYFETDEQMRYYSFEGSVAAFINAIMEGNASENPAKTTEFGCKPETEKDILKLEKLNIIEVL